MNASKTKLDRAGFTRREGLLALIGGVAALSGCGGGGGDAGFGSASVGSGGTGSFSSGAITGFGSIIVNGVRFDDSRAQVTDDDGVLHDAGDLRLGMVVSISASAISASATATATSISFGSELRGPIDSIGTQSLVVLGQTVNVGANTVFEGVVGGLPALSAGQIVEVHGFVDPAVNQIFATRIEREATAATLKLQGQVQALNTTAKTFNLGTTTVSYAGVAASALPANLANGLLVRVVLAPAPATGTRTALRVRAVERRIEDHDRAELEGTVTAFTSTSSFSVNGVAVDASKASFPNGSTGVALGVPVEVKGSISGGVLVASEVKVEDENEIERGEFELHGAISNLDVNVRSFALRGLTVTFAGTVRFDNGDATTLSRILGTSATVEVRGTFNAATNTVTATRITFES